MLGRGASITDTLEGIFKSPVFLALLAAAAALFAQADWVGLANANGFGADFHATIWAPDRAVLHGVSPYPSSSGPIVGLPAVYLPPTFLATLPLGWLSLHLATLIWLGCLIAAAFAILAVLEVRDPWCYALFAMSLPVVQDLVLGNASILVALGAALAWRFRDRPFIGPVAVAATVTVKFFVWPLLVWLLIVRPLAGVRAAVIFGALTLGAWAAIGFHGFLDYPALMHDEGRRFAWTGVLFVALLLQLHISLRVAAALGILGGLVLLGLAWVRRSSDIESFSLALLASLVATPVGWAHYLTLIAVPLVITSPRITLAWSWFPALWLAAHLGSQNGQVGYSLVFCLFAAFPVVIVFALRHSQTRALRSSSRPTVT